MWAGLNLNSRAGLFFSEGTGQFELKTMDGKRRISTQSYAPTADDLKAFAGRYESTEIGTVFLIEPRETACWCDLNITRPEARSSSRSTATRFKYPG